MPSHYYNQCALACARMDGCLLMCECSCVHGVLDCRNDVWYSRFQFDTYMGRLVSELRSPGFRSCSAWHARPLWCANRGLVVSVNIVYGAKQCDNLMHFWQMRVCAYCQLNSLPLHFYGVFMRPAHVLMCFHSCHIFTFVHVYRSTIRLPSVWSVRTICHRAHIYKCWSHLQCSMCVNACTRVHKLHVH